MSKSDNYLKLLMDASKTGTRNIQNNRVNAAKEDTTSFTRFVTGKASIVTANNRSTINVQGAIVNTGIATDISVQGKGMLVVKESATSNANLYTRDGSFRLNNKGYWLNPSGCVMLGWKLDATGNLPTDSSLLESLEQINVSGSSSQATASDKITVGANLNANKTVLEGAGEIFKVNKNGINASIKIDEILMPEILGTGSLTMGDKFTLTADPNASKTFVYGGISISKKISETNFYGTNTVGGQFRIVPGVPANANELQVDTGIRVRVGGGDWINFKAIRNNANTGQNEFNSLQSLGEKLKSLDLITTIKDDRLVIAPKDGNSAVEFQNFGSNMVETLGLVNIAGVANPALDGERFSTLQMLRDKVNATKDTFGLFAELNSTSGSVNIHSLLATSSFAIKGESLGVRSFSRAVIGAPLAIGGLAIPEEQRRATVIIDSPKHDLREGDFVKIMGLGNPQTPDGIYMVTGRSSDQFTINLIDAVPGNFVVQPANGTILNAPPGGYTWQKVAGSSYPLSNAATANSGGGGVGDVTITMPPGFVGAAGGALINAGDIVYISGIGLKATAAGDDITVPDGYYVVNAIGANTFDITPTAIIAAAGAAPAGPVTVRKVGDGAGFPVGGINFNTNVMVTTGGAGSNRIKLFMPSHNYTIGDSIRLTGLAAPLAIDGITVRNNMIYKIVDVPNAAALAGGAPNFVTFEVVDAGAGVATTGDEIVGMATYGALGTDVGQNFRVDHYSRTFEYLSLNQEKELFAATYSASDSKLGLSSGNHSADRIFSHSFVVFDSLGGQHTLLAKFARLGENRWTVEISAIKSEDGTFEVKTTRPDGVLQSGTLTFEPNGALQSIGDLASPFLAEWTNGSAPGSITIDWGSTGSVVGTGSREGIRQVVAADNVLMFDANGNTAGTLVDVNIDENGNFIAIYDNGTSQKLYRIPIATQIDLDNGMEAYASGYRNKSPVILKEPGVAGTATIVSKSVEGSNGDTTTSLIELQGLSNDVLATSKTLGIENNNLKTIVNAIEVR
ncbi:Flagellar hook protein FlgE [Candidatus Trichorickettsia mobilis]|uniref:Flagellar hook protein FlgE n=1 Tax=Candidatus Trichorickettsia mobilis TaxID=1346319 RepID=A0ABZ0UQQ0_9RICK|nr:flagellar basal body FlgE domain-containing protein [Candidatus Trichorickettsia mobilis]WPY00377.1 Flagellar hook protein FlgE [Candidatus Trichorickettsia mobilis]